MSRLGFRTAAACVVAAMAALARTAAEAAEPGAAGFKEGDRVVVTKGPAPVMIGGAVVEALADGTMLTARKVKGKWVQVALEREGKTTNGWINAEKYLAPAAPGPEPKTAPAEKAGGQEAGESPVAAPRAKLLASLIAKGDRALGRDNEMARAAYSFAGLYAPEDRGLAAKLKAVPESHPGPLEGTDLSHATQVGLAGRPEWEAAWPKSTPETQLIELRILLDERLVGNLHFHGYKSQPNPICYFLATPTKTLEQVVADYGKPSAETRLSNGSKTITYGRFRIAGNRAGKAIAVLFESLRR